MRVRKRLRRIKRLAYLGGLAGAVFALRQAKAKRDGRANVGAPATWPPLRVAEPPVAAVGDLVTAADAPPADDPAPAVEPAPDDAEPPADAETDAETVTGDEPVAAIDDGASDGAPAWVDPDDDGGCPLSHPVKANGNSRIFHVPGGQFYDRTRAERCYIDAAAAEADGYRAAKAREPGGQPT